MGKSDAVTPYHRPVLRLVSVVVALSVSACASSGEGRGAVEPTRTTEGGHGTAIAVVKAWSRAVRRGDAETACGLVTEAYADLLVAEAMSFGAAPTYSCIRAIPTLARVEFAPPVIDFVVESATADSTVLILTFKHRPQQKATLLNTGTGWLVNGVSDAPEPT